MQLSDKNTLAELLTQLNSVQREAVEYCDGPSLVIAGAGSGKTRVLTYKIAYLLEQGLPPYYLLALTFTNKAAREMRSRVADLVGEKKAQQVWMGTFHSIFSRILRREAEKIGFDANFTIFDASDSLNLVKLIIKDMNLNDKVYRPGSVYHRISRAKNSLITPGMYERNTELTEYDNQLKQPLTSEIYRRYQERLRAGNSMDFDDLLMYTNILFRDHPEVLGNYQNRFQYILVDEYQDTNFAQHLIVKQMANAHRRVFVVGDDAQSIYSFRGANIENILKFTSSYPEAHIFKLEQNYRSTQNIVNAANSLIKKNVGQIFKNVFSAKEEGEKIEVISAFSDFEEGLIVANKIVRMRYEDHVSFRDFAILYRINAQSRIFEEALRKKNVPYRIYGGLSFYQRKEIKDIVGYFRLIVNPHDEEAFRRIINNPARGIGEVTVKKISVAAQLYNTSMWDVLSDPLKYQLDLNAGTLKKLSDFHALISDFIDWNEKMNAFELAQLVIKNTGIVGVPYGDMTAEGMGRAQNIQELLNAMNIFVSDRQEQGQEDVRLTDFLAEVSLLTDQDIDGDSESAKVTLMTVHSAKGLEFNHVFVVGLEEDLFPWAVSTKGAGLEEERRLFYVAITRAKKTCTLSFAKSRFINGRLMPSRESRFLRDIDRKFLSAEVSILSNERMEHEDGFWKSLRHPQEGTVKEMDQQTISAFRTNKPLSSTQTSSTSLSKEALELREGDIIEHERFGRGVVSAIESSGNDKRAFVDFDSAGRKQLLVKFAKFKIVK